MENGLEQIVNISTLGILSNETLVKFFTCNYCFYKPCLVQQSSFSEIKILF